MLPLMFNLNFIFMARNKVLERAKVTMPSGRSAFDLSQVRSYNALAGEIGIAYCQPMVAGTKGKISRKCFTRTAKVVSPAFHSVTEHFDFFIVPIHSLWRAWENWKLNINDMQDTNLVPFDSVTTAPDLTLPTNAPRVDFNGIIPKAFGNFTQSTADAAKLYCKNANGALDLLDALQYDEQVCQAVTSGQTRVMNLLRLAAYQKCYFDHYRNTAYESNNPYAYNFDWLYDSKLGLLSPDANSSSPQNPKDSYVMKELLKVRRVNYRNDFYHNIYPALNYVSSSPAGTGWQIPSNIGGASPNGNGVVLTPGSGYAERPVIQATTGGTSASGASAYTSVQAIRAAFALDKLMRASAYAPKHVRDQYKALYGVDGVEDFDMKSERIGSFQSDVVFQEVTSMAETDDASLGELGAKGVGGERDSNAINFYCKYDSIVIGLHYFMPRARYDSWGLHPFNTKISREAFFIKAFENLGLRPFYLHYIDGARSTSVVVGWTVPNFDYKILPDLNTGLFKRKYYSYAYSGTTVSVAQNSNELRTFVPHNEQILVSALATAEYFKVAPEDLDNLFANSVPNTHDRGITQFFGEFRISVPVVAPMSVHGQPSL